MSPHKENVRGALNDKNLINNLQMLPPMSQCISFMNMYDFVAKLKGQRPTNEKKRNINQKSRLDYNNKRTLDYYSAV
jgi:hypothetical protein